MPRLDHVNIEARDAAPMVCFLKAVLGAEEGPRPPFPFPGHWLYLDGHPAIHINTVERDEDFPAGLFNHVAFGPYDRDEALERVKSTGFRFRQGQIPGTTIGQIFVHGPEGILIELQYRL
ncbi:VOC family protein [Neorhizobium sp. NCHU2750]|uniref:VOC family protein n=1 Tax=Neorhizobium sp. NCHU2750 TaxID=1825976 RepID=UPI000E7694B9|nr:glyoxalase [Neorhizobium sp. NCHU2750]